MRLFSLLVKYDTPGGGARGPPGTKHADDGWKYREDGDHGNHIVNVLPNVGDEMPKRVSAKDGGGNPQSAAEKIKKEIARIRHLCGARDGRTKRSNDGDESGENHGAATVFFVEVVGALEMAAAEEKGIFAAVEGCSSGTSNPVANLIAGDSAKHDWPEKPLEGDDARVGKDPGGDEKRVTGKKKSHKEAGFDEDDGANERSAS